MSDHLAVAMVTATLRRILGDALSAAGAGGVGGAQVTTMRPSSLATIDNQASGINLFLYHASPRVMTGTDELPVRRSDGTVLARPAQYLKLDFLLTFYGDESTLEPQRLLGLAVAAFTRRPVLDRALITDVMANATKVYPDAWEQHSDLASAPDSVRLSMIPLDLEAATKLWSTLFHTAYRLSIAYQATTVIIHDATVTAPDRAAPPELNLNLTVVPSAAGPT